MNNKSLWISALVTFGIMQAANAACPTGTASKGAIDGVEHCSLKGKYLSTQLSLTAENVYLIEDGVFIGGDNKESSTLRIESGTTLRGLPGAFISVSRGSKIVAEGTAQKPIVFTSLKKEGCKRGEWGGLVLNGNAPINACKTPGAVCEGVSEGIKVEPVRFGGNNPEDSSGTLKYVRVEFAGYPISQDNELNGITFNAVGRGTELDYIQVHMNADDGVEFFGGTAQVKHLVLTGNEDDSIDWDYGFQGKIQFALIEQANDSADNGIEADNLKSPMDANPRSNPELSNITFLGGAKSGYGLLLRHGTAGRLYNVIVSGFTKACLDIDSAETFKNGGAQNGQKVTASGLVMVNSILNCKKAFETDADDAWSIESWYLNQADNKVVDPLLQGWVPAGNSPALGMGITPDDLFFDPVSYIGAIGKAHEDWTAGWITRDQQ